MISFNPKIIFLLLPLLFGLFFFNPQRQEISERPNDQSQTIYDFEAKDIDGNVVSMSKYRGRVVLIVNVASECGLTNRDYKQLSELHRSFSSSGLSIAAFPSNDFANQEPWAEAQIKQNARTQWGVEFDLFAKVHVNGVNAHPLFTFLQSQLTGTIVNSIKWNFTKFIIDRNGAPVRRYAPYVQPKDIVADIETLLKETTTYHT